MSKIFVGLDFSINSPGLCAFKDDHYEFISFSNNDINALNKKKIAKSLTYHKQLTDNGFSKILFYNRYKSKTYSDDQIIKIIDSEFIGNMIVNEIINRFGNENLVIGLEGFSYGSKGNAFIDIIMFNAVLRNVVYRHILTEEKNNNELFILAPSEIKRFAGKGNANKLLMFEFWKKNTSNDEILVIDPFYKWTLEQNFGDNIPKPIDDLIDAYWICRFLRSKFVIDMGTK